MLPVPVIFLKYLTCNFDDLKLGQFKVIRGQRSWRQSIAQERFHIRLPLTPKWYLSPFSRYMTLKLLFYRVQAETGSKLTRMRVYYFRCYWPSNLLFVVRCVAYISNLRKIVQKRDVSRTGGTLDRRTDGQTDRQRVK